MGILYAGVIKEIFMYSGSDLITLQTALNTLTNSGFLQYDLNIGQVSPYLQISVSAAQLAMFPALSRLPQANQVINLYYTTDFTPPVATFISNFQTGVQNTVTGNAAILAEVNAALSNWPTFETTYNSFG
jgi:hypothetical protein